MATHSSKPKGFEQLYLLTTPKLRPFCISLFELMTTKYSCSIDIRESYATFSSANGLVAAIYPLKNEVDVILALPFNASDKHLFIAVDRDYKWRTLPSGVCVATPHQGKVALARAEEAHKLVTSGVVQDQDGENFARPKAAFQPAFKKKLRYR